MERRIKWVYLLPTLHFCACLVSYIGLVIPSLQHFGIVFTFILLADLPISVPAYALGWKFGTLAADPFWAARQQVELSVEDQVGGDPKTLEDPAILSRREIAAQIDDLAQRGIAKTHRARLSVPRQNRGCDMNQQ